MKLFGNKKKRKNTNIYNDIKGGRPKADNAERSPEEKKKIDAMIIKYQKKKKKRRIILISVLVLIVAAIVIFYKATVKPPDIVAPETNKPGVTNTAATGSPGMNVDESNRKDSVYTFVIVGSDNGYGNTDTMIVGAFDAKNKKLNMVNIPRDTLVNVPWSVKKANTLMSLGDSDDDIENLKTGLKDILGFTVDSYMVVDLKAFVALVDAIGGVYFDVPVDMNYEAPDQDLYIHINSGYQYLNGADALKVVRFRSGYLDADIGRIATQQKFLKEVAKQCLQIKNATKIDDFIKIFTEYVETDLGVGNIIWYSEQFMGLKEEDIVFHTLPANYNDSVMGLSYCSILIDEWLGLVNESLNPYKDDITEAHVSILTRDEDGDLYATSGEIAGGYYSFYDNTGGSSDDEPVATEPPVEVTETPIAETTPPVETEPVETETAEETVPPEETDTAGETGSPGETEPPVETAPTETVAGTDQPAGGSSASPTAA